MKNTSKKLSKANYLYKKNKVEEAELICNDVLVSDSSCSDALRLMGLICTSQNRFEEAIEYFLKYLDVNASDAQVWMLMFGVIVKTNTENIDNLFLEMTEGFISEFTHKPNLISDLGKFLYHSDKYKYSLDVFTKAVAVKTNNMKELNPECFYDLMYMAEIYKKHDKPSSAVRALKLGMMVDPDKQGVMSTIVRHKHLACEWDHYHENNQYIIDLVNSNKQIELPFAFLNITSSGNDQLVCANSYKPVNKKVLKRDRKLNNKKIRIGYVSADYYHHATTILAEKLFEMHDKKIFEIIGFDLLNKEDDATIRIKNSFDEFYDVSGMGALQIAKEIYSHNIDILVDLKGYTRDSMQEIFSYHPAPIQVNYLGYPGTMGDDFIDYIIADSIVIPKGFERFYGEKVVRLPYCYQINNSNKDFTLPLTQKNDHGLPADSFVFCCFNNNYKITPDVFKVWMGILGDVGNSVLWLLKDSNDAEQNLRIHAQSYGIAPERLVFAPRIDYPNHIARHDYADLFLDTLPINAHTTASDALWCGVPVLTFPGESFASRVAASLLNAVGLNDLIVNSYDEYHALAVEIANNKARLDEYKSALSKDKIKRHLFNPLETTRYIEAAYLEMHRRYVVGLPPDHIDVAP